MAIGDGVLEISHCEFKELGAFLAGMTFVTIYDCFFEDCSSGIELASTVSATLIENRIENAYLGIRVADIPFDFPDGPLVLVSNVIRNSKQWGISLCTYNSPFELTFEGSIQGFGNIIEGGHGYGPLCPTDYEWPEGLFSDVEGR
jgi:Right handed beta helix region